MRKLKIPPSHGVSAGPKIVAAHTKIFSSLSGAALAPCQHVPRASAHGAASGGSPSKRSCRVGTQEAGRRAGRARGMGPASTHLWGVLLHLAQVAHEAERRRILEPRPHLLHPTLCAPAWVCSNTARHARCGGARPADGAAAPTRRRRPQPPERAPRARLAPACGAETGRAAHPTPVTRCPRDSKPS
jgi:hypothetical protein